MAVLENGESKMGSSDLDNSIQTQQHKRDDDDTELKEKDHQISNSNSTQLEVSKLVNGNSHNQNNGAVVVVVNGGFDYSRENGSSGNEGFKRDMKELEELFSKLNPMAKEFVPVSAVNGFNYGIAGGGGFGFGYPNGFVMPPNYGDVDGHRRRKNGYSKGKRRMNSRTSIAQREEVIRRTVYISDIDQQITEEQLAGLFLNCGQAESAIAALNCSGSNLGSLPIRVSPSKTPVRPRAPRPPTH